MSDRVSMDRVQEALFRQLSQYDTLCVNAVQECVKQVAKETVKELKATSPKRSGGYAASWTSGEKKKTQHAYERTVYAAAPHYSVAHLLEKGHASRNGGRVSPQVHIQPAEQKAIESLQKKIKEKIEGAK